jgi:hypothetical protein
VENKDNQQKNQLPQLNTNTSNSSKQEDLPTIDVEWIRFPNDKAADLANAIKKPTAFGIYGGKDTGKSCLVENLSNHYPHVVDLFGARDNEALAWCRSPRSGSILFLKGPSVELQNCGWPSINATDLKLSDIDKYDAIISVSAFYGDIREEWYSLSKLMDKLWHRTNWTELSCLNIREAANLLYSRVALGETQADAKNYIIYVLREMRHCGLALAVDSIRWYAIDIDVRTIADYTFLKAQGIEGLPDNLHFLYQYFDPFGIMRMGKETFALFSREGPIAHGTSTMPYWHKQEYENMLNIFDIKPKYNEKPDLGDKGYARVGDYGHVKIIQARFEGILNEKGERDRGMEKLGKALGHSSKTILDHINHHNNSIQTLGECDKCTRVQSPLAKQVLE